MKPLNTYPIEQFLEKARIAVKSNQKNLVLDIKEVQSLSDSLAMVMTRIAGTLDADLQKTDENSVITVKMDGGGFQ